VIYGENVCYTGKYEAQQELLRVEQIIRPTGLLDPQVEVRPIEGQIDDLIGEVKKEIAKAKARELLSIKSVLTPEQLSKLPAVLLERQKSKRPAQRK
jgi:excinuclease UvrABC helicase subunit UvrB